MKTNEFFIPGKLSLLGDGSFGSSGKGVISSYICQHADNWQFACNSFSAQAGHTIRLDDGKIYFYQTFNSCAYQADRYEKLYTGPDAAIELAAVLREIEESNIPRHKIGIHPLATVIQPKDSAYERGEMNFDGDILPKRGDGTSKHGSTNHGTAPARVRKMLRRKDALLAKDVPELKEFICDVSEEIMKRLDKGQSGLLEVAQGFPLSLNHPRFYPYCTNRNVTVSAALDGMMLPPVYAGNVCINFRTMPIRINSNKFIGENGRFLTWQEMEDYKKAGKSYEIYKGDSGPWYPDERELTWEEVTAISGSPTPIMEMTSVTKLPRRIATFSKMMLDEAIRYNRTPYRTFISINFMNYIDHKIYGKRGTATELTDKCNDWLKENVYPITDRYPFVTVRYLDTGPFTEDKIIVG